MTSNSLWYPYAQMRDLKPPFEVEAADGVYIHLQDGRRLVDAIASWWCVIHGYNHPELNAAVTRQCASMAHIMLGGLSHAPARDAADLLVRITPEGLGHVFFSDSGSVAVEVSLKMALQYWINKGKPGKKKFLALRKAYHGDTIGAMSVCDPDDGMHALFKELIAPQIFLDPPASRPGDPNLAATLDQDLERLEQILEQHASELAAFIVEPLAQLAGGFRFHAPEFLTGARELCDRHGVLMIFDEVATGFGRTGTLFAADRTGITPDIMILGKGLTGGYTGHAATLATTEIFESFYGDDTTNAFMHGPTYMANPLACALMLASYEIFEREKYLAKIQRIESILIEELTGFSADVVRETRVLGAIGVVELHEPRQARGAQAFAAERGVWIRPLDQYVYTMPPYTISEDELRLVCAAIKDYARSL